MPNRALLADFLGHSRIRWRMDGAARKLRDSGDALEAIRGRGRLHAQPPDWKLETVVEAPPWSGWSSCLSSCCDPFGAECPREGLDYLGECHGAASVGIVTSYGGVIALQVAAAVTACTFTRRAGR